MPFTTALLVIILVFNLGSRRVSPTSGRLARHRTAWTACCPTGAHRPRVAVIVAFVPSAVGYAASAC
jgi:hypothetical protein